MGSSTDVDIMPAVVTIWPNGDSCCVRGELPPDVLIPYFNTLFDIEYKKVPEVTLPCVIGGWTSRNRDGSKYEYIGKRKRISACFWSKRDKKVYEVNEDPYEAGGGVCMTYCAYSEEVLKEFLQDMGLDSFIPDICLDETIQQTL